MNKSRRILFIVLAVLGLLLVGLLATRNILVRKTLPVAIKSMTGFETTIGDIDLGLFPSVIDIRDLTIRNPADFEDRRLLTAPEVYITYKPFSLWSRRRVFPSIRLRFDEIVVVKNARGDSNLARLMSGPSSGRGGRENYFETLELSLGRISYVDYTRLRNGEPSRREVSLNYHRTYHNVVDVNLKTLIVFETLRLLPERLHDITPASMQKDLADVTGLTVNLATNLSVNVFGKIKTWGEGLWSTGTNHGARSR